MELLNWEDGIGSWRLNSPEDSKFPIEESLMGLKENRLIEINEHNTQIIDLTIEDEYNTDKLCGYIKEHKIMMIRAEYGGCGKGYTCKFIETRGPKVLFVCPTNKLASNYKADGCTINKFFGIGLTEDTKMAKFDDSGCVMIVFDEIFFCSVRNLARIKRYCESNPDKIVVATGDTNQLECIDCITNQNDYDEYYSRCVDMIFPIACSSERARGSSARRTRRGSRDSSRTYLTTTYLSPNHQQILQNGQGAEDQIHHSIQKLHLPNGQRGGQIETAQAERAARNKRVTHMQIVAQAQEASL